MTIVPRMVTSLACFHRIQEYLNGPEVGTRQPIREAASSETPGSPTLDIILQGDVSIVGSDLRLILQNINLDVRTGSVTIVTGAVGTGKSTLAKAMLGEVSPQNGIVQVASGEIAYCSQLPWLPNKTVRGCILGPARGIEAALYEQVIRACCLSQDLRELPEGDMTMVGVSGMNLSGGQRQRVALARAAFSGCSTMILDDSFNALDKRTAHQVVQNLLGAEGLLRQRKTTVVWITHSTQYFSLADEVIVLAETTIKERGPWAQLQTDDPRLEETLRNEDESTEAVSPEVKPIAPALASKSATNATQIQLDRRYGESQLYGYYIKAAGIGNTSFMILCTATYSFCFLFPQYWLKIWLEAPSRSDIFYMVGYVLLLLMSWISTNGIFWSGTMLVGKTSGVTLHERLLAATVGAPMLYIADKATGTMLNFFSQDIRNIDNFTYSALWSLSVQTFKLIMQGVLMITVQPYMVLSVPIGAAIVYVVQKVYLRTSRQLRLLELESRSVLYAGILETVQGGPIIRAFKWQREAADENSRNMDESHKSMYLYTCLQRWLNVVLDMIIAGIGVGAVTLAVIFRDYTTGADIGIVLNLMLIAGMTLLAWVENYTRIEISLGTISRIKEVDQETPQESQVQEKHIPPPEWPQAGCVELTGVTAAYNDNATVLKQINLKVEPGQTVVVCGRTGSGKSSLLLVLLRLINSKQGRIEVDGVDLSTMPRHILRRQCFVTVTQDAFILATATLRLNLDPSEKLPDNAVLDGLRSTGLHQVLCQDTGDGAAASSVLDKPMSTLTALSVGQTQLFALTRALLQTQVIRRGLLGNFSDYPSGAAPKPTLLLDEITSSLDEDTASTVYDVIQKEFVDNGHTVIMITHKLDSFRSRMRPGKDRIVWMAEGNIEKID
jgi:ATP-binding cassette, subfamily C (CFTR/MRP), member 1